MRHTSEIANGIAWLLVPALVLLCIIVAILFGVAALFGGWAYVIFGAAGVYTFCWRMTMEQRDRIVLGTCGGIAGAVACWTAAAVSGIAGIISAMFIGALVCAVLVVVATWALHRR